MQKVIVVSGIPGAGKSAIAEGLGKKLSLPVLSIDPIEAAMRRSGIPKDATGIAAYEVAATVGDEQLKLNISIIIDAVSPVEPARKMWRKLANQNEAQLVVIEVICSDQTEHKRRIEARVRNIDGMPEITWDRVLKRKQEFEPWDEKHLTLDSINPSAALVENALAYVKASIS